MPYLKFEFSKEVDKQQIKDLLDFSKQKFGEIMMTGTDHIAVSIRQSQKANLCLGRTKPSEPVCIMNFDIRKGRTSEQKRTIVLTFMNYMQSNIGIKTCNQYLTFTEHSGDDFNLYEKQLSWEALQLAS